MHDLGLGKGQRHAHKTGQSLAQRLIPTLNMGGFSRLFAHGRMLLLRDDKSIDSQKVGEAMALAILLQKSWAFLSTNDQSSSSSSIVEVGSSGSGASRVVRKGGSCATFF